MKTPSRAEQDQLVLRISGTIANEYDTRQPDHLPLGKLSEGTCQLTRKEVQLVVDDAVFNSDTQAVDVGPDAMPLGVFNAYRALAKQGKRVLEGAQP